MTENHIKKNQQYLTGNNKEKIKNKFGDEFNIHPSDIWTYTLENYSFGLQKTLVTLFQEDIVIKTTIKRVWKFNC